MQAVPAQNVTVVAAPFGHSIHQPVNVSTGTPGTIHLAPFTQYISAQAPSNVATSGIGAPTPIYATLQSAPEFLPAGEVRFMQYLKPIITKWINYTISIKLKK